MSTTKEKVPLGQTIGALHIFVLCSFAIAQPLYDLLSRNGEFFVAHGAKPGRVGLFMLTLSIVVPSAICLVEVLMGLLGRRVRQALHLAFVFGLTTVVFIPAMKAASLTTAWTDLLAAGVLSGIATELYRRYAPVRTLLTVLSPMVLVFPALFLLSEDIQKLVFPETTETAVEGGIGGPAAERSLILVVLDELPTSTLLNANLDIDAKRFPALAALASDGAWFRNARTVAGGTVRAVPSILSGSYPPKGKALPVLSVYPRNLFTLLGPKFRSTVAYEPLTALCPTELTGRSQSAVRDFYKDVAMVYMHLAFPTSLTEKLPPITQNWRGFAGDRPVGGQDKAGFFRSFIASIDPDSGPGLYFLHSVLPHVPWRYLPSGREYTAESTRVLGLDYRLNRRKDPDGPSAWDDNEWAVMQGFQRHLMQAMFADALIAELIDGLKAKGLYEDCVLVVTADHGASFRPGKPRRRFDGTEGDVYDVPLIVKTPDIQGPLTIDAPVLTIDVLPTLAAMLGAPALEGFDGRSLMPLLEGDGEQGASTGGVAASPSPAELLEIKSRAVERLGEWLAESRLAPGFPHVGGRQSLLGRSVDELEVSSESSMHVELELPGLYYDVKTDSSFVPSQIYGRVRPARAGYSVEGRELVVAVNGVIRSITRVLPYDGGTFMALVPEESFVDGFNVIDVHAVEGPEHAPRLSGMARSPGWTLTVSPEGRATGIELPSGTVIPIEPEAIPSRVNALGGDEKPRISGWAVDEEAAGRPKDLVLFVNGEYLPLTSGVRWSNRGDLQERFGVQGAMAFSIALPKHVIGEHVQVFGILDRGVASELTYSARYPWGDRGDRAPAADRER